MFECTLPYPVSSRFFQYRRALPPIASSPSFDFLSNSPTCLVAVPRKVVELDNKAKEGGYAIEGRARLDWKKREDTGYGSVHSNMQLYSAPKIESLIGVRISQYCIVDMNKAGMEKKLLWMHGVVTRVSDGTWIVNANAQTNCWGAGKAAEVDWDACEKANYPAGKSIVELKEKMWNKDKEGAWCKCLGKVDYGIKSS